MMTEAEFLGMLVGASAVLIGLFKTIFKPLNENTKTMSELLHRLDRMAEKMDERDEELKEHRKEFEEYKEKVRESQKRQWEKIDELNSDMIKVKHNISVKGENKNV